MQLYLFFFIIYYLYNTSYIVDEIETTNWMEAPTTKIFGETQKEKLVLITCGGEWDNEWNTYNDRLIVYAKLKENE